MELNSEELLVIKAVKYYPSVSMLVSIVPAITLKTELQSRLKTAADNDLPVFVMGAERMLGHFVQMTENKKSIAGTIHGNFEESSESELLKLLKPHLDSKRAEKNADILKQMDDAMSTGRLEFSIKPVWTAATQKLGKLLVVESGFIYPADHTSNEAFIQRHDNSSPTPFYIKDAVDDIIAKVIEFGGQVVFMDEMPDDYQHIALIRYY